MSTHFNTMLSAMSSGRKYTKEEINRLYQYDATLSQIIGTAVSGKTIPCPFCRNDMMNVKAILEADVQIRGSHGSHSLTDCLSQSENNVTGWECQTCGVFEVELPDRVKTVWDKDSPGGTITLSNLILSNFPKVEKIHYIHSSYVQSYIFQFSNMMVTFGYLKKDEIKDEIIGQLSLIRELEILNLLTRNEVNNRKKCI